MGVTIRCFDAETGTYKTIEANSVGASAGDSFQMPAFGAQRINLSMADVHESIAEGRAAGFKPFNLYNSIDASFQAK